MKKSAVKAASVTKGKASTTTIPIMVWLRVSQHRCIEGGPGAHGEQQHGKFVSAVNFEQVVDSVFAKTCHRASPHLQCGGHQVEVLTYESDVEVRVPIASRAVLPDQALQDGGENDDHPGALEKVLEHAAVDDGSPHVAAIQQLQRVVHGVVVV